MKINIWGVRGSIPTTSPDNAYYGGNTSCASVWEDGWLLVLDGGSGIQRLTINDKLEKNRIDILLTHLHLDHIQGLGFFHQLFDPNMDVHIWGPASSSRTLHSRLSRYLSPPLFPVRIRELPCKLTLHERGNSIFTIGPFTIQSGYVIHPGPTVGYRIKGEQSVFAYLPDHEPALGPFGMIADKKWISGYDLAVNADLLLHDAQYTQLEYENRAGWGHSTIDDAGLFASATGAKQVLFSHHDPSHSDLQLNKIFASFQEKHHYLYKHELAKEGMEIQLK